MRGNTRFSSFHLFAFCCTILLVHLHAAVFKVNIKQPTVAQSELRKKWQRNHHLAFTQKSPKSIEAFQRMKKMHPKVANQWLGAAGDGESTEIDDLELSGWKNWLNPQGTIKLGIPPQDFIVAFSMASPDTFVSQEGSVDWDNFMSFNENKSYTFSSDGSRFQDSLFRNSTSYYRCITHNTGFTGKDIITLGDNLVLPLKFGIVNNVTVQTCMDWQNSDIEGIFGISLAESINDMAPSLQQIAPILDEPVISVLTTKVADKKELEYHFKIGSPNLNGHCAAKDYTFFPSTSGFTKAQDESKKDGYHTRLFSVELLYANGSFSRWNLRDMDMQFRNLVQLYANYPDQYIYGDQTTVDEVVSELGGGEDWIGYSTVPCNITATDRPDIVFKFGNSTHKAEWVVHPEEYTLPHPYFTDECVSLLQYHPWYPAWSSSEYHTKFCFAVKFGAGGNMIGLARPKK